MATADWRSTEATVCRFCFEEGTLIRPCACKGSQEWIHESCLLKWYEMKPENHSCSVCKTDFIVEPLGCWEFVPPRLDFYVSQPFTQAMCAMVINMFTLMCFSTVIPDSWFSIGPYTFHALYQIGYYIGYVAFFWKRYYSLVHDKKKYWSYWTRDGKQLILCQSVPLIGLLFIWNPVYHISSVFMSMFCQSPLIYYHYMALKAVNDNMPIRFRAFVEPASSSSKSLAQAQPPLSLQQVEALDE
jgi:hypothetical protein